MVNYFTKISEETDNSQDKAPSKLIPFPPLNLTSPGILVENYTDDAPIQKQNWTKCKEVQKNVLFFPK